MSFRQPRVGTRTDPGTLLKGQYTEGFTSVINFEASLQPLAGDELETLPEGLREKGAYRLYTDFALRAENQQAETIGDKVTLFGKEYLVVFVEPWQNNVIPHYKAIVSEADD